METVMTQPIFGARLRKIRLCAFVAGLLCVATLPSWAQSASNLVIRVNTNLGNIDVELLPGNAPKTVANFLRYVNTALYNHSIIHRSVPGFVFQGGGYSVISGDLDAIPSYGAIVGEAGVSNTVGTLAMALSTGPNSATNEWFFNLADNSSLLDGSGDGGPFTVFGKVANSASTTVMNQIAAVPVPNPSPFEGDYGGALDSIPLINYTASAGVTVQNLVMINFLTLLSPPLFFQNGTALGSLTLNTSFQPTAWQGTGAMNSGWQERAVADVNGDGVPDIIFQNGTLLGALLLNAAGQPTGWVGMGSMGTGWELRGAADITGIGRPQLIFQNGTLLGLLTLSSSGAPTAWSGIGSMATGWDLRAVADLNASGRPDLIFQNGTSLGVLQLGTNGLPTAWNGIGAVSAGWTLSYAADIDADGQPDLIFQNGVELAGLRVNTSFQPVTWEGIGSMGSGWTLPGDY